MQDRYIHRIQTLELQARFMQAREDPARTRELLEALLPDFVRNAHAVLAQGDEPAPAATNLGEALRAAGAAGLTPSTEAVAAFEKLLEESHAPLRTIIAASRLSHPTSAQVLQAGVILDTASAVPSNLEGAELVIVTAHGGLVPGNRYFQVVRDDADLRIAGADLGTALKNVGVAVLFICSGGRLDPHPMANRTLGLARQVLGNGGTTVVASPWPIDSRIPSYWIPAFLEAQDAGVPVIDATFQANAGVRDYFSSELRDCIAMGVYGDPLRAKERQSLERPFFRLEPELGTAERTDLGPFMPS